MRMRLAGSALVALVLHAAAAGDEADVGATGKFPCGAGGACRRVSYDAASDAADHAEDAVANDAIQEGEVAGGACHPDDRCACGDACGADKQDAPSACTTAAGCSRANACECATTRAAADQPVRLALRVQPPAPVSPPAADPAFDELQAKLAARDALQREIDELCERTQTWPQVMVRVKIMEVNLTKMRALGFDVAPGDVSVLGAAVADARRRGLPAVEAIATDCAAESAACKVCSCEARSRETIAGGESAVAAVGGTCQATRCDVARDAACPGDAETATGDCPGQAGSCSSKSCGATACTAAKGGADRGDCATHGPACRADAGVQTASTNPSDPGAATRLPERDLAAFLGMLEDNNVARVLAAPTLVAVSGRPASFHVGGETPIPAGSGGNAACRYVEHGTKLDVVAQSLGGNRVRLQLRPRVSEISDERSLIVGGAAVPALKVTEVDTACELEFGQTAALTGLVQRRVVSSQSDKGVRVESQEVMLLVVVTPEAIPAAGVSPRASW